MCGAGNPDSPPWHIVHFILIGLIAFSSQQAMFIGGQVFIIEAVTAIWLMIPILFIQLKLGGMVQKSVYGLFHSYFPLLRGVAVTLLLQMFITGTYWTALPVYYICAGFASVGSEREAILSCANAWNTDTCRDSFTQYPDYGYNNVTWYPYYNERASSPIDEYLAHKFFQWPETIPDDLGGFSYGLGFPAFPIALVITWIFIFLIVAFGPRVFAWVISILAVTTTIILIGVLGYGWNVVAKSGGGHAVTALLYYYLPDFSRLGQANTWMLTIGRLGFIIPLWFGSLPTFGKLIGNGKILRNITWLFVPLIAATLRHLPALTIAPYQYAASVATQRGMNEYLSIHINLQSAFHAFVSSPAHASATFFFFFAGYIHYICNIALMVLILVDNILEAFDWLLKKCAYNRRIVWFVTTAIMSLVLMLLGLPFTTRAGYDILGIVDLAVYRLSFVPRYFLGLGLLVIYIWQKVAVAERLVIGIWAFLAWAAWVVLGMVQSAQSSDVIHLFSGNVISKKWLIISWLIAAGPYIFIVLGVLVYVIQLVNRKHRSGGLLVNRDSSGEESATLTKRGPDGTTNVEDVQLVSSF
ncbi:sodium- and chloride-dependent GABA transporter ine-like [Liolophura sinensis]|uniref:sodium- and chloride-dependent GABA transporter ine-like n=1 Tax=Liolophura sinensis TaxID=3198878 RepID=UPI003158A73E